MEKPTTSETIGAVVIGVILVVVLMQGQRDWSIFERLTRVEVKVEMYHE